MPRSTRLITESQTLELPYVSEIANVSGIGNVYAIPAEELDDVDKITDQALRNAVMNTMYRLLPGQRRTLAKGKYQIICLSNTTAFLSCSGLLAPSIKPAN